MSVLERNTPPGSATLRAHLAHLPPDEVVTTIISYEEQMRGWMAYLTQSRSVAQQVVTYGRLLQYLDNYRRIIVLAFDEAAAGVFQRLRRTRLRVWTMDLKIAAIVLSRDALLLSKNLTDFGQVPGLQVEVGPQPGPLAMHTTTNSEGVVSAASLPRTLSPPSAPATAPQRDCRSRSCDWGQSSSHTAARRS